MGHQTSHFKEWPLKKWSILSEIQLKVQNNLRLCWIIACSDRYEIQSLLSPVAYLVGISTSVYARDLCAFTLIGSFHLWIMHLTLRNFPVKTISYTTTYWQQLTGKQHREIKRINRAARPNVVYEWLQGSWKLLFSNDEEIRWVLTAPWMIDVNMWLRIYSVVNGLSAPVCIWKRLWPLGKPCWTWLCSFSTSTDDGNSTADVFIKQSKAKISRDVLGGVRWVTLWRSHVVKQLS